LLGPAIIPCFRELVRSVPPPEARITSIGFLTVARITPLVRAFRMRWTRPYAGGLEQNVSDHIYLGRGRTIVLLSSASHASAKGATGDPDRASNRVPHARIATEGRRRCVTEAHGASSKPGSARGRAWMNSKVEILESLARIRRAPRKVWICELSL
jgi:hypothetical protein